MDCSVCQEGEFFNVCQNCGFELQSLMYWMNDSTGDSRWSEDAVFEDIYNSEVNAVQSFLAGARMSYDVIKKDGNNILIATENKIFDYLDLC